MLSFTPLTKTMAKVTTRDIYFFVPNLIGYARIALALASYVLAFEYPEWFLTFYSLSFVLDAADGWAARKLGQSSSFGAILDMFTDRAATSAAIVVISHVVQPITRTQVLIGASLVFLDVASHFVRMYASMFTGKTSHKDTSDSIFSLLGLYYSNRKVMGAFCVGQEFFYILFYAYYFYSSSAAGTALWASLCVCAPLCFLKQVVNVQQLLDAMYHIAEHDVAQRNTAKK